MIDGCAICSVLRFPQEASADGIPVALGFAAQQPDRDRMAERAVRPEEDLAAHATRSETIADVVGREQTAARERVGAASRITVV